MGSNVGCFVYGGFPCALVYGWDAVVSPIVYFFYEFVHFYHWFIHSFIDAYIHLDGSLHVVSIIC